MAAKKNSFLALLVHALLIEAMFLLGSNAVVEREDGGGDDEGWQMVRRKGDQFLVGRRPFYVNGFNTYWLMVMAADESTRPRVTDVFRQAAAVGMTVCRTWAFSDGGWRALQKSPSVYDEEIFEALDFVLSEARKYGIRLILSLANNWEDYGGKAQYVKWARAAGVNLSSDDDFFVDGTIKNYFKGHVKTVLMRVNTVTGVAYKDDPTVFAWELMNEPRCAGDSSGETLQAWIEEMAFFVKSVDPVHLLEIGSEGFYGPSTPAKLPANPNTYAGQVGTDFVANHRTLGVDFASVHVYPDAWLAKTATAGEVVGFAENWIRSHIEDADEQLGMPVVFTEFGVSARRFDMAFRDTFIQTVYKTLLNSTRRGGSAGGCLLWQLFPEGTDYMDDGYAVVLPASASTAKIMSQQSRRLQSVNAKCDWSCRWTCMKAVTAVGDDGDDDEDGPLDDHESVCPLQIN